MQIHELSRRRTDEGIFDTIKGIGAAGATALGKATSITDPNAPAKSAGIIDPAIKLAAVRKNKDMQRVAAQLAQGWTAQAPTKAPAAAPAAPVKNPLSEAVVSGGPTAGELSALDARIAAATQPAATPPGNPATAKYRDDFLAYVNQKTAIRDSSTYQMIGLNQIIYQSGLRAELDKAEAEVLKAYEAGQDVTPAATDYILTAMAGAQLIMSKNKAGVDQQLPAPVAPATTTGVTAPVGQAATGSFLSKEDVQGLFNFNGVDNLVLTKLGTALQQASGTNTVNRTGNDTVDNLLRTLGFKVK